MKLTTHQQGFTLIEVMVALAVFSIGVLAMMTMQTSGIKGNATANTITMGTLHGTDQIETFYGMAYEDPLLKDTNGDGMAGLDMMDDANGLTQAEENLVDGKDETDPDYRVFWSVVEEEPMPWTKSMRVVVKRRERGQVRSLVFNYTMAGALSD